MNYDMIDRFLRNNLHDDDYAEYSAALDSLCVPQPDGSPSELTRLKSHIEFLTRQIEKAQAPQPVPPLLTDDQISDIYIEVIGSSDLITDADLMRAVEREVRKQLGVKDE